jgi:YegS/Rv2252/BmrU family lipid kinase
VVVLNPRSGHGATGRGWRRIELRLRDRLGAFEVEVTRGPGDAGRIAAAAARGGARRLVVAGGDGTCSEVASGLLTSGLADRVDVGVLPLGTGRDLSRTLGVPSNIDEAIDSLAQGRTRRLDALRVRCVGRDGVARESYSINVASFGLSGLTVELVAGAPPILGGSVAFLAGAVSSILRYRVARVRIRSGDELACDEPFVLAAAANGRFFGGGMNIAPGAAPDDGQIDLVIIRAMSKPRLIASLLSLYRGTHLSRREVSVERTVRVEVTPHPQEPRPIQIEADGESLGVLPATIEVIPAALTFFGVRAEFESGRRAATDSGRFAASAGVNGLRTRAR